MNFIFCHQCHYRNQIMKYPMFSQDSSPFIKKGDVIGCALDLTVPVITFYVNGRQVNGAFTGFNLDGMFFPVISASAKLRLAHL